MVIAETVKCKWCGKETFNLGTKECNGCWELRSRIEADMELASRILETLLKRKKEE